jgi:hypothetical protein
MNRHILLFICAVTLAIRVSAQVGAIDPFDYRSGQAFKRPDHEHDHEHEQEQEKREKYTCPMHPEVVMDHPGNCPKCGMQLVPLKQNKRSTSTHASHLPHQSHSMHPPSHGHGAAGEHPPSVAAATSGVAGEFARASEPLSRSV